MVIAHEKSCYLDAAEKIGMLDHVKKVLTDAKAITRLIYSNLLPFDLMRKQIHGSYLIRQSKLKSVSDFLTLGNILSERENLIHIFRSETWSSSALASKPVGKRSKIPALWNIIDEIWNNYLHCPLHSAGYYLNPNLFCSNDFFVDAEVTNGLLCCIVRMIDDHQTQAMIVPQLDAYTSISDSTLNQLAVDERSKMPPALWWASYGDRSPELQMFAIKILSQPCSSASRFKLKKDISELVHEKEAHTAFIARPVCQWIHRRLFFHEGSLSTSWELLSQHFYNYLHCLPMSRLDLLD
ncbi:hypothetical protein HPP92_015820 [Vanilla planifolia]|uniref:HAT C-terminal dimerisation domain-containing protein n=1 Tax=Vanilla planifolia TaxID=51239 RepID=A0A835UU18_VANPL|nr:hypothetical protein HPP92_015820 [Vanilla planifolia]